MINVKHEIVVEEGWLDELLLQMDEKEEKAIVTEVQSSSRFTNNQISSRKAQKYYRKPPFKVPFIPSIRILKRDIRRKYLDIFNNVVNSHNDQLFSSFVDDFYRPDAFMAHSFPENAPPCFGTVEIQGLDLLKRMQAMSDFTMPDSVTRLSNAQICKRLNEESSRIIGNYHVQATAIYLPKVHKGREVDSNSAIIAYDMDPHEFSGLERAEDLMQHVQIATNSMELCLCGMY